MGDVMQNLKSKYDFETIEVFLEPSQISKMEFLQK